MDLGLQNLIEAGKPPGEAVVIALRTATHPSVQEMLRDLASSPEGREMLAEGRQIWTHYGFAAEWESALQAAGVPPLPAQDAQNEIAA